MVFTLQADNARNEVLSVLRSCCPIPEYHQLLLLILVRGAVCSKAELVAEPCGSSYKTESAPIPV